jgi:Tol biopolymer transport system component
MSTSRATWRRRLRSNSALLLAALVVTACGAARPSAPDDRAGLVFSRVKGTEGSTEWSTWVANADGSDARFVTKGFFAGLSPDGRLLTYRDPRDEEGHVFLRDLTDGKTRDLGPVDALAWPPDGSKLAISTGEQLLLIDPRTGESRQLVRGKIWEATFSPDGKAIAFAKGKTPPEDEKWWSDLFVVRVADAHVSQLTRDGVSHNPVWGGSWIAFSREVPMENYGSSSELYLMHPDGSDLHQLTIDDETVGHGRDDVLRFGLGPEGFSADGKRLLVCVLLELGPCEPVAFTVPDGPGRKLSLEENGAVWSASISPDGSDLLFEDGALDDEAHHSISTIPFEGGKPHLLLRNASGASWARLIPRLRDDTG